MEDSAEKLGRGFEQMGAKVQLASLASLGFAGGIASAARSAGSIDIGRAAPNIGALGGAPPAPSFGLGRSGIIRRGHGAPSGFAHGQPYSGSGMPGDAFFDAIIRAEGTGKHGNPYDTSLGYVTSPKPLTQMTMAESLAWGDYIRKQTPLGRRTNSSAKGAFQFTNSTQRDGMRALGLKPTDLFNEENQRRLALWRARVGNGLGAWEGFKSHPGERTKAAAALAAGVNVGSSKLSPSDSTQAVVDSYREQQHSLAGGGGEKPSILDSSLMPSPVQGSSSSRTTHLNVSPTIHINGAGKDADEIAELVQRHISDSMNWRNHDISPDLA